MTERARDLTCRGTSGVPRLRSEKLGRKRVRTAAKFATAPELAWASDYCMAL